MKRFLMVAMVSTLLFTLVGCKSSGTVEGKAGDPVISDGVDEIQDDNKDNNKDEDIKDGDIKNKEDNIKDKDEISDSVSDNVIIMTTDKDTYTPDEKDITLTIDNKSSNEYYYGVAFTLEQNVNGEWVLLSPEEEVFVIEIAYILEANGTGTIVNNIAHYGDLADGHYRIVKEMIMQTTGEEESKDLPENLKVAAEFNITSVSENK